MGCHADQQRIKQESKNDGLMLISFLNFQNENSRSDVNSQLGNRIWQDHDGSQSLRSC